ncbi:MAG: ComEC/Rec2 family competence protein, partial [Eubacteriales bacterium]|nr:ComEC/Rec2 family competence protein [Eubacteriales bacterium]
MSQEKWPIQAEPAAQNAQKSEAKNPPWFHARPVAVAALGLLFGLLIGDGFSLSRALMAALVLLVCALASRLLKKAMFAVFLVCMALGLVRVALAAPTVVPVGSGIVQGRICETPEAREGGSYRVYLADATLNGEQVSGRLRLFGRFSAPPAYGQVISTDADVVLSAEKYRFNDRYQKVFAVAFSRGEATVLWQSPQDFYGRLLDLRENIGNRIAALFPNAPGEAKGMMLGDTSDIDDEMLTAFRNTGIAHLLSVSGLHVSLLAVAFSLLFRRNAWVRFAAVAAFCALYAAITAFSPPVVRSGIMLTIGLLAFPLRRRLDAVSALAASFVLILLYNPYALWNAGFQLSFVAVLSMILLAPIFQKPLMRLGSTAAGLIGASAAVVIGTMLTSCYFFGQAQLLSLATNLFVIPISGVFLIPAFLGVLLSYLWLPLGNLVCWIARIALDVILAVARFGGQLTLTLPAPNAIAYLLWLAAMVFASRLVLRSAKTRALSGVLLMNA